MKYWAGTGCLVAFMTFSMPVNAAILSAHLEYEEDSNGNVWITEVFTNGPIDVGAEIDPNQGYAGIAEVQTPLKRWYEMAYLGSPTWEKYEFIGTQSSQVPEDIRVAPGESYAFEFGCLQPRNVVPEPSTLYLIGAGLLALVKLRRKDESLRVV